MQLAVDFRDNRTGLTAVEKGACAYHHRPGNPDRIPGFVLLV